MNLEGACSGNLHYSIKEYQNENNPPDRWDELSTLR